MRIQVHCPAKVNSFLSVGLPEANGYHPIRTTFHAVSLGDTITVERGSETRITSNWPDLPRENTLTRTLALVEELVAVPPLEIFLEKRIPAESGLGGGSSDAAGLLRAICRLTGLPLDQHIFDVASTVGKDVPFFLIGGVAKGEGLGDRLTPMEDLPTRHLLIAKPQVGVSSGAAYAELDRIERPWRDFPSDPWELYNDFERVAPCLCGELSERMRVHGAQASGLSGSGSAVFGLFASEDGARLAAAELQREFPGLWTEIAHTLTRAESLAMEVSA